MKFLSKAMTWKSPIWVDIPLISIVCGFLTLFANHYWGMPVTMTSIALALMIGLPLIVSGRIGEEG